jgi:hypothetical protein
MAITFFVCEVLILWKEYKIGDEYIRYQFENKTDGGVVQFRTYEDSKRHQRICPGDYIMIGTLMAFISGTFLIYPYM